MESQGPMNSGRHGPPLSIFDCHTHIFAPSVVTNVSRKNGLTALLRLDVQGAVGRTDKAVLMREAKGAGISGCLLLPTAPVNGVRKINGRFLEAVEGEDKLFTAGTLHPLAPGMDEELERLSLGGVRPLKFSSFSQGFDLEEEKTLRLFEMIRTHNRSAGKEFFVILDTFCQADLYFGAPREHVTTPEKLGRLASAFPEIDFVGAHMGGLAAPFHEIEEHLAPRGNLYLDTSNASHVLAREDFLRLLALHGPGRILFGTDWPWFEHAAEVERIRDLLDEAGFSLEDKARVFSGNIVRLLGLTGNWKLEIRD